MAAHSTRGRPSKAYGANLRGSLEVETGHRIDRQAAAGEEIVDTTQHERTAQARLAFPELIASQPARADDATVQGLRRTVIAGRRGDDMADISLSFAFFDRSELSGAS